MKSPLFLFLICLQTLAFGQITLEELSSPDDYNMNVLLKSPQGEYFTQPYNDNSCIYSSTNGTDWTKSPLPDRSTLYEMQFLPDGTPLFKSERNEHMIRRNGIWYTMDFIGGFQPVEASFIKGDTLFAYQDNTFAYSLNKGQTFTTVFTYLPGLVDHSANLLKFDNHFVLHHTAGATDYLSVFDENGDLVFDQEMNLVLRQVIHNNDCGEVLFVGHNNYYLLKEQGLSFQAGDVENIIPDYSSNDLVLSHAGQYYRKDSDTFYKTTGCNFTWETWLNHPLIESNDRFWINFEEDVFLWDLRSDFFIEQASGTGNWEEIPVEIDFAYVTGVDESGFEQQVALTSNALFSKNINEAEWVELDSSGNFTYQVQYSPDGDLYVCRNTDILYSTDNGTTFSLITLPDNGLPDTYRMEVLEDDIIFILNDWFGESYYTLNNGEDWIETVSNFFLDVPIVKMVDNYILIAELQYEYVVIKIDLATNDFTFEELGDFYNFNYYGSVIQDDGTIYFQGQDYDLVNPEGLYRYRYGEELEFIGQFPELSPTSMLYSSGTDLYAFEQNEYHIFDGQDLNTYPLEGLPSSSYFFKYSIAENEFLYIIDSNNRIFRSTEPLSYPQFITGTIHHNLNQDCIPDDSDPGLQYWQVRVESDDFMRIKSTNLDGNFSFSVPDGNFTLSSQPVSANWDLCEPDFNITIDENTPSVNQDFLAKGLADCADLELDFSTPLLRRCFDNYYTINVRNTGPLASAGTILTLSLDPFFDFISASIPYNQIDESTLEFDLGILEVNDQVTFKIFFTLTCDAELGMLHCLNGNLSDDNLCSAARSEYRECQMNIGSYDPNDKRIFNENGMETETVDKDEYIYYHIRFQNTGTDTAFTVRIIDPLSPMLDLSTLQMLSASHPYDYDITDGPALNVHFENILLPDSTTNEPASHGFFKFRIKPLPEFDYGTSIPNQAAIYFDFNDPILTNEAILLIEKPVSTKEPESLFEFEVFPNPAGDFLEVYISEADQRRIDSYEIVNQLGQVLMQATFLGNNTINVERLVAGVFTLVLKENGTNIGSAKFIKL